jgi:IS6 family transposase
VDVDHTTVWRWVNRYAPELDQRLRPFLRPTLPQWRADETYIRVAGEWTYLYRAVDPVGATVDFYLFPTRDVAAAHLFLRKAMADRRRTAPMEIVVDGNPTHPIAIRELQREEILGACRCRCSHGANNIIEQDHRGIQQRTDTKQHFRSFDGATHTNRRLRGRAHVAQGASWMDVSVAMLWPRPYSFTAFWRRENGASYFCNTTGSWTPSAPSWLPTVACGRPRSTRHAFSLWPSRRRAFSQAWRLPFLPPNAF